jgi:hypothetical protein
MITEEPAAELSHRDARQLLLRQGTVALAHDGRP